MALLLVTLMSNFISASVFTVVQPNPAAARRVRMCLGQPPSNSGDPQERYGGGSDGEGDWRSFRARLVLQEDVTKDSARVTAGEILGQDGAAQGEEELWWAHRISTAEPGCLLLANPAKFIGTQSYFARAVILLVEHDNDVGSIGFMLNRFTPYTVGDVVPSLAIFASSPLHMGGPVGDGLQFIHGLSDVHGSREIASGVFYGGDLLHAAYLIRRRCAAGEDIARIVERFVFFYRYTSWAPGQLARELANTTTGALLDPPSPVWYTAASSPSMLLQGLPWAREQSCRAQVRTSNVLWQMVLRGMGEVFSERIPMQERGTSSERELERIEREKLGGDYWSWVKILDRSSSSEVTSSMMERALLYVAEIEENLMQEDGEEVVMRLGGGKGGERAAPPASESSSLETEVESSSLTMPHHPFGTTDARGGERGRPNAASFIEQQLGSIAEEAHRLWSSRVHTSSGHLAGSDSRQLESAVETLGALQAINTVLFESRGFALAPNAAEGLPSHHSLLRLFVDRSGGHGPLAAVYGAVAYRMGLQTSHVAAGGQYLLRPAPDEERGERSVSGRRCPSRNVWPLKRVDNCGNGGRMLLRVTQSTASVKGSRHRAGDRCLEKEEEEEEEGVKFPGRGAGDSGGCFYVDAGQGGRILSDKEAMEWRLALAGEGTPIALHEGDGAASEWSGASRDISALLATTGEVSVVARLLDDLVIAILHKKQTA